MAVAAGFTVPAIAQVPLKVAVLDIKAIRMNYKSGYSRTTKNIGRAGSRYKKGRRRFLYRQSRTGEETNAVGT